jgi:hypothetical protein
VFEKAARKPIGKRDKKRGKVSKRKSAGENC